MTEFSKEAIGAISTIVAAFVGGIVALLGLVISKEQKISEFRQQWIEELRKDIATLIACNFRIFAGRNSKQMVDIVENAATALAANEAAARIRLRLNSNEPESVNLLTIVEEHFSAAKNVAAEPNQLILVSARLIDASKIVLKKEWNRVRSGELTYRVATRLAFGLIVLAVLAAIAYGLYRIRH